MGVLFCFAAFLLILVTIVRKMVFGDALSSAGNLWRRPRSLSLKSCSSAYKKALQKKTESPVVIVPCFNEEENIADFYHELLKNESFFQEKNLELEILYICAL